MSDPYQGESSLRETSGGDDRRLDFRPGMGMWWEITRSTEDTSAELFETTNLVKPRMARPPVHVHSTAEVSYEVIEGALEVFMNGEWNPVRAGDKAAVTATAAHGDDGLPAEVEVAIVGAGFGGLGIAIRLQRAGLPDDYVLQALGALRERDARALAVRPEVQDGYNARIQARLARSVWNTGGCGSWYLDAHGRNSTMWPDFTFMYRRRVSRFGPDAYDFEPRLDEAA